MATRGLPTGTVTFLFSDMERSTQLVRELGSAAFTDALDQHHRVLRDAIAANSGIDLGTEGDSFFVVFPDARSAVDAAVHAQIALAAVTWPNDAAIRVRIGLHTGIGMLGGDNYVGLDVNRVGRIGAAGHGSQVLISDATRSLVAGALPEGVRLRPLGSYRLKDLTEPEALWQVEVRGLPASFPPLRALDVRRAHLPPDGTTFVGRHVELDGPGAASGCRPKADHSDGARRGGQDPSGAPGGIATRRSLRGWCLLRAAGHDQSRRRGPLGGCGNRDRITEAISLDFPRL